MLNNCEQDVLVSERWMDYLSGFMHSMHSKHSDDSDTKNDLEKDSLIPWSSDRNSTLWVNNDFKQIDTTFTISVFDHMREMMTKLN